MADIICPSCSTQYRISDEQLAKVSKLRCKKCNTVFQWQDHVQAAEEEAPAHGVSSTEVPTLAYDASKLGQPPSEPEEEESSAQESSLNFPLGDMSLDISSSEMAGGGFGKGFGSFFSDEEEETAEGDEEIQDHISAPIQPQAGGNQNFSSFNFSFGDGSESEPSTEEPSEDFSFSAAVPEGMAEDEEGEEGNGEEGEPEAMQSEEAEQEAEAPQAVGLDLSLGAVEIGGETVAMPADSAQEQAAEESTLSSAPALEEQQVTQEYAPEEELSPCCIDSLAMGLPRCELCGKDLQGKDRRMALELQKRRRQQLKQELSGGSVQVGFSEEQLEAAGHHVHVAEDFSDVEKALDDLASGTFHHAVKKKASKKQLQKTLKTLMAGAVGLVLLAGVVFWTLIPSAHEQLQKRYDTLSAAQETNPKTLVELFFDAAIAKDADIFRRLTIMPDMPAIVSGKVLNVGEEYEAASIGTPGKRKDELEKEINTLEQQIKQQSALLDEYSSKNLSPTLLQERIEGDQQKLVEATDEFNAQDAELRKKLDSLEDDVREVDANLKKCRQDLRKYISDATEVGKAIYNASVKNQKFLEDKMAKLILQHQREDKKYKKARSELEQKFQPEFVRLQERIKSQKALLREANLLQDKQESPVVVLNKEIEKLSYALDEKKKELEQISAQLSTAMAFFTNADAQQRLAQQQAVTEFRHVSKNVAALVKMERGKEQQMSLVLKRYQAVNPSETIESQWLVEKMQ